MSAFVLLSVHLLYIRLNQRLLFSYLHFSGVHYCLEFVRERKFVISWLSLFCGSIYTE